MSAESLFSKLKLGFNNKNTNSDTLEDNKNKETISKSNNKEESINNNQINKEC